MREGKREREREWDNVWERDGQERATGRRNWEWLLSEQPVPFLVLPFLIHSSPFLSLSLFTQSISLSLFLSLSPSPWYLRLVAGMVDWGRKWTCELREKIVSELLSSKREPFSEAEDNLTSFDTFLFWYLRFGRICCWPELLASTLCNK